MIRTLTLPAFVLCLAAASASAQSVSDEAPVNDTLFAEAAADGGMAEVGLGEIGRLKAVDPELKKFSEQMVAEHTRMNQELIALCARKQITLPRSIDPRAKFCAQSLQGAPRDTFDRCYAKAQLTAHLDAVATFEAEAERGQDPEMRALAAKALPRIKEHLHMIKPIAMKFEKQEEAHKAVR